MFFCEKTLQIALGDLLFFHCVSGNNDAEEESDEDEDYVPSEDWKKVCKNTIYQCVRHLFCQIYTTKMAWFVLNAKQLHQLNLV